MISLNLEWYQLLVIILFYVLYKETIKFGYKRLIRLVVERRGKRAVDDQAPLSYDDIKENVK